MGENAESADIRPLTGSSNLVSSGLTGSHVSIPTKLAGNGYDDDKVLVVVGNFDIDDRTAVRDYQTSQLHVGADLPDEDVCFTLGSSYN